MDPQQILPTTPSTSPTPTHPTEHRTVADIEGMAERLEQQGCSATDWQTVEMTPDTDAALIRDVEFIGTVRLGRLDRSVRADAGIRHALLRDCILGDDVRVRNVPGGLTRCTVGRGATIENVARVEFEPEAPCGVGQTVSVLDETGSRPVTIYPGLSAQTAALMARSPRWAENTLGPAMPEWIDSCAVPHAIGEESVVRDCGLLLNVSIGPDVTVEGAVRLVNGAIINNAAHGRALTYVGHGVDAENFILEDGRLDAGTLVRNCYIGQGAVLDKGMTAHDSLFFANSTLENGEACALFAGPYTVSMHKGTLLIGCETSFMNAGSATNQSNHMYKLGPVHWGILERGVKTSSNSYLMLGARIGAFSLLMGAHKTHPDSTQFPFSYLFGDERGATVVVPGQMLRSCGLMRDELKWPTRDRRMKRRLRFNDRVIFSVLTPYTVDRMLEALDIIEDLLKLEADDDRVVRYRGMKFARAALERARQLYTLALFKYLDSRLGSPAVWPEPTGEKPGKWVDLSGQIMPRSVLEHVLTLDNPADVEAELDKAYDNYEAAELNWIADRFGQWWRDRTALIHEYAAEFDRQVDQDRTDYLADLAAEQSMLSL